MHKGIISWLVCLRQPARNPGLDLSAAQAVEEGAAGRAAPG
jgi:hypothetical protein